MRYFIIFILSFGLLYANTTSAMRSNLQLKTSNETIIEINYNVIATNSFDDYLVDGGKRNIHYDSITRSLSVVKPIKIEEHSPHKATIYSLILPGLGQIYNKQWWKVPIIYAGLGAALYGVIWNSQRHSEYSDAFVDYSNYLARKEINEKEPYPENPSWDKIPKSFSVEEYIGDNQQMQTWFKNILKNRKDNFKRNRDLSYILTAVIYALNIIDADVFAHFYNYDINNDLSMSVRPVSTMTMNSTSVGLSLSINF